ncbi:Cytosolic sulfotransferase 16 [Hibiscus syriacus]|uniref:Sulfotransferase n=1 Tax=Hibiscus syriacus TaxID=106335 RepID=A0A6A3AXE8_HIBSY|nr:Cytosolic sulfotransferase 16 [Hibiscus syriacus]
MELDHAHFSTHRDLGIPVLATHVPYSSLPTSIIDSGCKIVYICRDPKDTLVTLYHFNVHIQTSQNTQAQLPELDEAFEFVCKGESLCGPYWDHVLGYWKASLEHPDKIFFLKYEEMKADTVLHINKLAEFIGYPFSSEEQQKGVAEKIVKICSFENLSNLEVNKSEKVVIGVVQNKMCFRKGKVGDWKNYMTPEMAARLDQIIQQKLSDGSCSPKFLMVDDGRRDTANEFRKEEEPIIEGTQLVDVRENSKFKSLESDAMITMNSST